MKGHAQRWILCALLPLFAAGAEPPPPPTFQTLRANENYDHLRPVEPLLAWQRAKMIGLTTDRLTYLSVGADLRMRAERTRHPAFGDSPTDNVLLHRWMAHAALQHNDDLTVFAQLKGSYIEGERLRPNPNDRNPLDLHQAFLALGGNERPLHVRAGRQELNYGSSRLIGIRNGPNVRLSFDALRLRSRFAGWELDAFVAQPVAVSDGRFTDRGIAGEALWGLYARAMPGTNRTGGLEAYYLGFRDARARYRDLTGEEIRHSFGLRWAGRTGAWDWDWEPTLQVGRFAGHDIIGWSLGTSTGYTFAETPFAPRLGFKANAISGDRGSGPVRTFNALYPRGAYFGEAGLIGPANLVNFEPDLTLRLTESWQLTAAASTFHRASASDGVYNPGRRLTRGAGTSNARSIGHQFSLESTWRPHPQLKITGYLSYFKTGNFLRETGPARSSTFAMLSLELSL